MKPLKPKINYKLMLKDAFFTVFVTVLFVAACWLQPKPANASAGQLPTDLTALAAIGLCAVIFLAVIRQKNRSKKIMAATAKQNHASEDDTNGR